jgi:hypothetical protein
MLGARTVRTRNTVGSAHSAPTPRPRRHAQQAAEATPERLERAKASLRRAAECLERDTAALKRPRQLLKRLRDG